VVLGYPLTLLHPSANVEVIEVLEERYDMTTTDEQMWGVFRRGMSGADLAPMDEGEDAVFMTRDEANAWRDSNLRSGRVAEILWTNYGWMEKAVS
jgi:hypothetical protein